MTVTQAVGRLGAKNVFCLVIMIALAGVGVYTLLTPLVGWVGSAILAAVVVLLALVLVNS